MAGMTDLAKLKYQLEMQQAQQKHECDMQARQHQHDREMQEQRLRDRLLQNLFAIKAMQEDTPATQDIVDIVNSAMEIRVAWSALEDTQ